MIITQTPFRMSFFGGGTDMESFFRENGGAVLSTTFDKYCYVNVRHLPRFFDYSTELSYSKTERVTCIEDIQHPAIRNAMKMLDAAKKVKNTFEEYRKTQDYKTATLTTAVVLKLSKASVTSYLPYEKGVYFPSAADKEKISVGAERQRRYRAMKR